MGDSTTRGRARAAVEAAASGTPDDVTTARDPEKALDAVAGTERRRSDL